MTGDAGRQVPTPSMNPNAQSHEALKELTDAADSSGSQAVADGWAAMASGFDEAAGLFQQAMVSSEAGWSGDAAEGMRAQLARVARWSKETGARYGAAAAAISTQSVVADSAKRSMPPPVPYDPAQMIKDARDSGNILAMAALPFKMYAQKQKHDAAHDEAARIVAERDLAFSLSAGAIPEFSPPPSLTETGSSDAAERKGPARPKPPARRPPRADAGQAPAGPPPGAGGPSSGPNPPAAGGTQPEQSPPAPGSGPGVGSGGPASASPGPSAPVSDAPKAEQFMPAAGGGAGGAGSPAPRPAPGSAGLPGGFVPNGGAPAPGGTMPEQFTAPAGAGRPVGPGPATFQPPAGGGFGPVSGGFAAPAMRAPAGFGPRPAARAAAGGLPVAGDGEQKKRPEYLVEPDIEGMFGSDEMTSPPVIGER